MTLPRKFSRPIQVDGQDYRYQVQGHTDDPHTCCAKHARQDVEGRVDRLVVQLELAPRSKQAAFATLFGHRAVTPHLVANLIRQALSGGWTPTRAGRPFAFTPR